MHKLLSSFMRLNIWLKVIFIFCLFGALVNFVLLWEDVFKRRHIAAPAFGVFNSVCGASGVYIAAGAVCFYFSALAGGAGPVEQCGFYFCAAY